MAQNSYPKRPSKQAAGKSGSSSLLFGGILVAVIGIGGYAIYSKSAAPAPGTPEAAAAAAQAAGGPPEPTPEVVAKANKNAAFGPHKQASLPPIPFRGYEPPRAPAVVTAAFEFAAEHPEVAGYVPCFCGCQAGGHSNNADCFVKSRAENGDVTEWEEHGVECAVCIDVATRSRQMNNSGASVTAIRAAIEKEFTNPSFPNMMATPKPPAAAAANNH